MNVIVRTDLIPAKVVHEHHANEDNQQAEALEGKHGQAKGAVLSCHAGSVVLAVGAALLAGQAVAGGPLICVGTTVCNFPLPSHLCEEQDEKRKSLISTSNPVNLSVADIDRKAYQPSAGLF